MPELPEVEVTRNGIVPHLEGRRIVDVTVRNPKLRWPIPNDLKTVLYGQRINAIRRRAKYLLLVCDIGTLIIHLGMSGSLRILTPQSSGVVDAPGLHDHFDLIVENQTVLRLRDPRRFGAVLWHAGDRMAHPLLRHLGPEPLSADFNAKRLYDGSRGKRSSVKVMLMDNRIVVGIGNIYANEALFQAGIHPMRAMGRISLARYQTLVQAVKVILAKAIEAGGSSLRDFVNSNGNPGYFQQQYRVYGRAGLPCRRCDKTIKQIKQGQRSSFYCSACQR